jgi:predicted  nucleic acid-binding Zn-ribbon protein
MAGPAATFREIHRLRRLARDLQEQLDRVPRQRRVSEAKVSRQEERRRECQEAIKRLKVTAHEKEGVLKSAHAQVAKHRRQLETAGSKKEYDALQLEIRHTQEVCARLEDEILAAMAEGEEKAAQLPELEKAVQEARDEAARFEAEAAGRQAGLEGHLAEVQGQLKEVEAGILANLRPQYNRIVAALGADALAAVRDRTCSACHSEITAQNYNDLQQELFLVCTSCGRILYPPEQPAAINP